MDALREGYDVYPVVDPVGGTSLEAHKGELELVVQAGAKRTSWVQLACELQRDWARTDTVGEFADILFGKATIPQRVLSHDAAEFSQYLSVFACISRYLGNFQLTRRRGGIALGYER